jgi:CHAD domain-containing protein
MVEARGWLEPSDYSQTARLATPVGDLAPELMRRRAKKVSRKARRLRHLDANALHELRKELKKLRYAAEILDPIYKERKVTSYIRSLKRLQDTFGSLNDATMVRLFLTGPEAPGRDDPDIQRAVGWVLGRLALRADTDRPRLYDRYDRFAETDPFWT